MNTNNQAQSEYFRRPADERFESIAALVASAQYDKDHSAERTYNLKDLTAVVETIVTPERSIDALRLQSPNGRAKFTHYSFGQMARTVSAPAGYLRDLPPQLAADCLNFGLQTTNHGATATLLVRANGGTPIIRSATSDTYGRLWDAPLYGELQRRFLDVDSKWTTPPTWDGTPAGAYRGDRDSFVIIVNGGSIVTDPSAGSDGAMYRGIMVRNSEVGHCSVTIESILFRYICGNHMLWGAVTDRQFRRRHVGTKITRDTMRELLDLAWKFTNRPAGQDEAIVRGLIDNQIAATRDGVIDELRAMGASKDEASKAYDAAEQFESGSSPRSFWGISQGLTRQSQASGYQDDRLKLDQLAAVVLARGAKLVTV